MLFRSRKVIYTDYPEVVKYINSRAEYFIIKDKTICKKNFDSESEEKSMIEYFVKRDVEYMELKTKVIDLERKIKSLILEKAVLEKKILKSNEQSNRNNETSMQKNSGSSIQEDKLNVGRKSCNDDKKHQN